MGCGCGRSKASRVDRLKKLRKNKKLLLKQKQSSNKILSTKKEPITDPIKKTSLCKTCPYGAQTAREKKVAILVCHKTNRLINNVVIDPKFNCPIKRWG